MPTPNLKSYVASFDLSGRRVLVVGGGAVALQKVKGLAGTGVRLKVVASQVSPMLARLAKRIPGTVMVRRPFRDQDLKAASMVFATTDSREVNARVARLARKLGAWVSVADEPGEGNFSVPAMAVAGPLRAAILTSGASPALAKALRLSLESRWKKSSLPWLLVKLSAMRPWLKAHPKQKAALLSSLTQASVFEKISSPGQAGLKRRLETLLKSAR